MPVEQPFGPTPTGQWARSEPAESTQPPPAADVPVEEHVRRQVAALDGIADQPLSEHARRYDEVHAELQAALTEIDGESG